MVSPRLPIALGRVNQHWLARGVSLSDSRPAIHEQPRRVEVAGRRLVGTASHVVVVGPVKELKGKCAQVRVVLCVAERSGGLLDKVKALDERKRVGRGVALLLDRDVGLLQRVREAEMRHRVELIEPRNLWKTFWSFF